MKSHRILLALLLASTLLACTLTASGQSIPGTPNVILWTTSTPAALEWHEIVWSEADGLFVASADGGTVGTNRISTSPDGITWTTRTTTTTTLLGLAYAPNIDLFVAVGDCTAVGIAACVYSSPDGITWTARTAAAALTWQSVAWSPDDAIFAAVATTGTGNRVMTSPDGITWTTRTSAADNSWVSVHYADGLFVAVASDGTNRIMTSADGITWTAVLAPGSNSWSDLDYSPELDQWVSVARSGASNRVMTSPDATNWTLRAAAVNNNWRGVAWSPEWGLWVSVSDSGTGNRVMASTDGVNWTNYDSPADNNWRRIAWSPTLERFVAVAYTGTERAMYSTPVEQAPKVIFCAEPTLGADADWGYDYKENASFEEDLTDTSTLIDLQDGFLLTGDDTNSAYLGKAFTPGTKAIMQVARIEADTEFGTSVARLAFTTGAATLSQGSTGDDGVDLAASGNGQNTGNFEDNIQAVLQEATGQWSATIRYTSGGTGLTTILGSANYGADPHNPHTFSFIVNTGAITITGPLEDADGNEILPAGFSIAPGKAQLRGEAGTIIERDVPVGLAGSEWKDSWFIAKGTTAIDARTILDDNTDAGQTDNSTCIFDLIGTAVIVGQSGSTPGGFIVQPPPEPGPGSGGLFDPANIDSALFIGFLLVAGMIFTGARQGIVGMGLVGVFLLGLGLGFALGWIPLWLVLVMFVVSLAAVWFLPKPSGDGVS